MNGLTIKLTELEYIDMLMELFMREIGLLTNNKVLEKRIGLMVLVTKAITTRARNMALVLFIGPMEQSSKANGKITKCMEEVCSNGQTAESTKENIILTRSKVMESLLGQMVANMKACGKTANNTVKAYLELEVNSITGSGKRDTRIGL